MDWIHSMQKAIDYIEDNLLNDINPDEISKSVYFSSYHFGRIFSMITGVTISEYIRDRRLSLAGEELFKTKAKIVDIALKYRYETPEGFAKAFSRFHGITPSAARESNEYLKSFNPLLIEINAKGGDILDYKIEVQDEFIGNKSKKLDGIHVMYNGTWDETINSDFLNSVVAAMHYIDKDIDTGYVAGVSGAAFNSYWNFGTNNCCDFMLMGDKLIEKTFHNLGYYYTHYKKVNCANWEVVVKRKIVESIDNDYPVIVKFYRDIYSVVSGYDNNGNILYGSKCWNDDADGYFTKENCYDSIDGVIILNGKIESVSKAELLYGILEWDVHMAMLLSFYNYENSSTCINGIACYDELIRILREDALFLFNDMEKVKHVSEKVYDFFAGVNEMDRLRYMCEEIFNNFIMYNHNKRRFTGSFLRKIAKENGLQDLENAALEFDKTFGLYSKAFENAPCSWMSDEKIIEIKDTAYRNEIANILYEIKEHEMLGISYIERVLSTITPPAESGKYTPAGL